MRELFNGRGIPDYHPGMILIKLAEFLPSRGIASFAEGAGPGMGALSFLERAGMLRSVTRLDEDLEGGDGGDSLSPRFAETLTERAFTASFPPAARLEHPLANVRMIEVDTSQNIEALVHQLAADPSVERASRVPVRYLVAGTPGESMATTAPPPATEMWNLRKIRWGEARSAPGFRDADSASVAVLDTGIDVEHPDLVGRVGHYVYEYSGISEPTSSQDLVGHGTHVSGTITAAINNAIGINGVCNCDLSVYKIFDDQPIYSASSRAFVYIVNSKMYLRALAECITRRVDVINLSIGGGGAPSPEEAALFRRLIAGGTAICAAMGNERQFGSPTSYPAAISGVIAVGATNVDDTITTFSNRGNHIALAAPGNGIWSTLPTYPGQTSFEVAFDAEGNPQQGKPRRRETDYDAWPGTSMATPHVTGAVALLRAKEPDLTPAQIRDRLMSTADRVPAMAGRDFTSDYGAGRLNLEALLW